MPTYEYECAKCQSTFDIFQSMRDEPLKDCPKCSSPVKRLIGSGAGIIFKGSGFYETDYKKKKQDAKPPACPNAKKDSPSCEGCSAKPGAEPDGK